jgi:hypothetical protein
VTSVLIYCQGEGTLEALEYLYQAAQLNMVHHIYSNVGTQLLMQSSVYGRLGMLWNMSWTVTNLTPDRTLPNGGCLLRNPARFLF